MNCNCNLIYKSLNGFSFVSLRLYLTQIHISEPIGQHMTSPPHFVTFSAFLHPSSNIFPLLNGCTDLSANTVTCMSASPTRVFTWDRLLEDSPRVSSSLPDRVCVFTAAWLHIPDISFFAIHLGPSSVMFSTRIGVSAHSRVCAQPPRGYIFRTFRSSLLQHIPSHTSVLSPAPTSAHACTVTIMKFLFLISENNAVHQVSRLVIPGNAGYPG
jgi:hypothetical protein